MSFVKRLSILVLIARVIASRSFAQDLFRVNFSATCMSFDSARNRVVTRRITERNIIAQAVGLPLSDRMLLRDFALVYNTSADLIQVVATNGQPIADVIHFGAGAAINDGRIAQRFTLMFFPGQTNEFGFETNSFGSAVITERTRTNASNTVSTTASIIGRIQFVLTGGLALGTTHSMNPAETNLLDSTLTNTPGLGSTGALSDTIFSTAANSTNTAAVTLAPPRPGFFMSSSFEDNTAQIGTGTFIASRDLNQPETSTNSLNSPFPVALPGTSPIPSPGATTNALPVVTTNAPPGVSTNVPPGTTSNGVTNILVPGATSVLVPGATTVTVPVPSTNVSGTNAADLPPIPSP